jgi:hypothetical protein
MGNLSRQRGTLLLVAAILLVAGIAMAVAIDLAWATGAARRERVSDAALAQAREALIAYAVDRPINAVVGPGYLPCPDLDDDGWAEATCGSQTGDTGQAQRIGRLPWKTLGLADLRDGAGERLWYAVSSKYKGLLNCGVSRACIDLSPDVALGTITVRDANGTILHDGTVSEGYRANEGGAIAVVFAPGAPLDRGEGMPQVRACGPGECDAAGRCIVDPPQRAAHCDPANYLDRAGDARFAFEDNADFVDRNDAAGRARNGNGFIEGPVMLGGGRLAVNDRLAVISYRDLMPRIMARVAQEVGACLRFYASRAENSGRLPWAAPACRQRLGAWDARDGVRFGRIPDTPFTAMALRSRLDRWPAATNGCAIAIDDGETAGLAGNSWWSTWKPYVFYSLAPAFEADSSDAECTPSRCIELADASGHAVANAKAFAVIVAGPAIVRDGFVQSRAPNAISDVSMWLESSNALLEGAAGCEEATPPTFPCEAAGTCNRVTVGAAVAGFNDVVVASP